jgi:hypothetical protein
MDLTMKLVDLEVVRQASTQLGDPLFSHVLVGVKVGVPNWHGFFER